MAKRKSKTGRASETFWSVLSDLSDTEGCSQVEMSDKIAKRLKRKRGEFINNQDDYWV